MVVAAITFQSEVKFITRAPIVAGSFFPVARSAVADGQFDAEVLPKGQLQLRPTGCRSRMARSSLDSSVMPRAAAAESPEMSA